MSDAFKIHLIESLWGHSQVVGLNLKPARVLQGRVYNVHVVFPPPSCSIHMHVRVLTGRCCKTAIKDHENGLGKHNLLLSTFCISCSCGTCCTVHTHTIDIVVRAIGHSILMPKILFIVKADL